MTLAYNQQSADPVSDQMIDSLAAVTSLTVPSGVREAAIQAQGGNVRVRIGTGPTPSSGGIIFAGNWHLFGGGLDKIQLVAEDTGAKAYVIYGR